MVPLSDPRLSPTDRMVNDQFALGTIIVVSPARVDRTAGELAPQVTWRPVGVQPATGTSAPPGFAPNPDR